jgi:hypothetical protein
VKTPRLNGSKVLARFSSLFAITLPVMADDLPKASRLFLEKTCVECHDAETKKGGLDLTALQFDPANSTNFSRWVLVHDRVSKGEMPPKKKARPDAAEVETFTKSLAASLVAIERARMAKEGRTTWRRLNRYEYENALRDLLHAPWLQVRDSLPEDGEADRFNKIGEALDVSHCSDGAVSQRGGLRPAPGHGASSGAAEGESATVLRPRPAQFHGADEVQRLQHGPGTRHLPGARL